MKAYTGTSGYSYKEWKGNFYPAKISADKMLSYYSGRLTAVEINSTFYRMPTADTVGPWKEKVPKGFLLAVKAPQIITHIKRLRNVKQETKFLFQVLSILEKQLGCVLFQFPAGFKENNALLKDFLALIPAKMPCAFDFRNKTWFNPETYALLSRRNFSMCLEDTDEAPVKEIISTADWGYFRMRRQEYNNRAISEWSKKIASQKWKKVFVFFKHEDDTAARGPQMALYFCKSIMRRTSKKR